MTRGGLRRTIFEANVRDYQGRTEVNEAIQSSLQERNEDFWWLNNGVTVIASRASQSGKTLTIEDPQIVNGLQTSTEVHNYFSKFNTDGDDRSILVRVVVPDEDAARDRIIKATNSQTTVQLASLRATDKVHRDIEEFLRPRGLYYDRRKNYYKNEGKPRDHIIGIPYLAQAVMAVLLGRPDTARARPSSLLKGDDDYARVFSLEYPIQLYHVCAVVMRGTEAHMRGSSNPVPAKDRNNLRFYVAMLMPRLTLEKWELSPETLADLDLSLVDEQCYDDARTLVAKLYEELGGDDQVAKGASLLECLKKDFR